MNDADFSYFYDNQPDYIAFRNDQEKQKEYRTMVDWKVRKLSYVITDNLKFRNVLEVGCAFGVLLNSIADRLRIIERTGIDISGENIKTASILYPLCEFYKGTLDDYVKEKNWVQNNHKHDLIVLSDIVEHVPDDLGLLKLVRQISEYVAVNLPLEKSFKNRNRRYGINDPSGHLHSYDIRSARDLFKNAGLVPVRENLSIAEWDEQFSEIYRKNRKRRVMAKSFMKRIFWLSFYKAEDLFKLLNKKITVGIYGANYFVFLRSS